MSAASEKTLFEKIIDREIPSQILYEDALCIAISDKYPKAPIHVLVVPKKVISRLEKAEESDAPLLGHLLLVAKNQAKELGLKSGFRIVINNGDDAGEQIPHLHVHLLGGRSLHWPPG